MDNTQHISNVQLVKSNLNLNLPLVKKKSVAHKMCKMWQFNFKVFKNLDFLPTKPIIMNDLCFQNYQHVMLMLKAN
jgi:hypothetical protein